MVAEVITLICGAPEPIGDWIDGFTNTVTDAGGVNLNELAFGGVLENVGAMKLLRVGIGIVRIGAGAHGNQHVLVILGEDDVSGPVTSAGELSIARDVSDDRLCRAGGMQIARVIWESLDGGGVADINIFRVRARVEGDAERMIQPSGELRYLCCLAIGPDATEYEQSAGTGVGEEEITIGGRADEAWHGESAAAESHHLLVIRSLHRGRVSAGIERDLEARRRNWPRVGRAWDNVGRVVHCLFRIGLGQVSEAYLAPNAGMLLVPICECGLAGDGLLSWERCGKNRDRCGEDDRRGG